MKQGRRPVGVNLVLATAIADVIDTELRKAGMSPTGPRPATNDDIARVLGPVGRHPATGRYTPKPTNVGQVFSEAVAPATDQAQSANGCFKFQRVGQSGAK